MRCCIIGSTGLLGQALLRQAHLLGYSVCGVARNNADFLLDVTKPQELTRFFRQNQFDLVINSCALVDFTVCEKNYCQAYAVNAHPSGLLATLAKEYSFKYVYISTDNYYTGDGAMLHNEDCPVFLLNEYSRSKFCGEALTLTNPEALVVRTNIVGFRGTSSPTFLEWVINALEQNTPITLFDDYFTSSIATEQFSRIFFDLLEKDVSGIFNLASREVKSKKNFVESLAQSLNLSLSNTTFGSVQILGTRRAESLGLDVSRTENIVGYRLPSHLEVITTISEEYKRLCMQKK